MFFEANSAAQRAQKNICLNGGKNEFFFRPCSLQSAFSTGSSSAAPAPQHNVGSTGSATLLKRYFAL